MKNALLIFTLAMIPLFTMAQQKNIEAFYEKYAELDNVSDVNIEGAFLKLTVSNDNNNEIVNKISRIRVMLMDEQNHVDYNDVQKLRKGILRDGFEDLIHVKDGSAKIDIMIREKGELITNILLVVNDTDNFVLFSIEGLFRLKDLKDIDLDIEGSEHLKKMAEKDYPRA